MDTSTFSSSSRGLSGTESSVKQKSTQSLLVSNQDQKSLQKLLTFSHHTFTKTLSIYWSPANGFKAIATASPWCEDADPPFLLQDYWFPRTLYSSLTRQQLSADCCIFLYSTDSSSSCGDLVRPVFTWLWGFHEWLNSCLYLNLSLWTATPLPPTKLHVSQC